MKKSSLVKLINPLNSEVWLCEDYSKTQSIDGIEYITVFKQENRRKLLMRKDALKKLGVVT